MKIGSLILSKYEIIYSPGYSGGYIKLYWDKGGGIRISWGRIFRITLKVRFG